MSVLSGIPGNEEKRGLGQVDYADCQSAMPAPLNAGKSYMKQLVIISGKGGTGKTTLAASFAALAENKITCDCDVDAADLHLLLSPRDIKKEVFSGMPRAFIDPDKCNQCGKCVERCRFSAINDFKVDELACEGCGVCQLVCPQGAIDFRENEAGEIFYSQTDYGDFFHARLKPGEPNSGRLVSLLRQKAMELAKQKKVDLILSDGSPGVGCPVIASLSGTDMALIVVEPTLSGEHDLKRVLELTGHFGIKSAVCINKYDINLDNTKRIEKFCKTKGVSVVGHLPYDPIVTRAMVAGKPLVVYEDSGVGNKVKQMWPKVKDLIGDKQ